MQLVDDVIFSFPGGKNCPIGNYMSQWLGNYYLSFMDNFILHDLKCKGYERYCDDFLLFSNDKAYLNECRHKLSGFLHGVLNLEFSKADLFNVKQGVDYCGYRHFGKYVLLRKTTTLRMKCRLKRIKKQIAKGDYNHEKIAGQIASANGLMKHACTYRLRKSVEYDYIAQKTARKRSPANN